MTTRHLVLEQLEAYLNRERSLAELVDWAETTMIEPNIADDEDVDTLMDILMYLGAADTKGFPLTWEILSDFLQRLGGNVRVVVETA